MAVHGITYRDAPWKSAKQANSTSMEGCQSKEATTNEKIAVAPWQAHDGPEGLADLAFGLRHCHQPPCALAVGSASSSSMQNLRSRQYSGPRA